MKLLFEIIFGLALFQSKTFLLINEQGGNMKGKFVKTINNQRFTLIGSIKMHHLDKNCKNLTDFSEIQTKML